MPKTDMDILNEFLFKVANADRVSFRRKIVTIKRFIAALTERSMVISTQSQPGIKQEISADELAESFERVSESNTILSIKEYDNEAK